MRRFLNWSIAGIVLTVSGCAVAPTPAPQSHQVQDLLAAQSDLDAAPAPVPLEPKPRAQLLRTDGGDLMCFDREGALHLSRLVDDGKKNTQLAGELSGAVNAMREERLAFAGICLNAEAQANTLAQRWARCDTEKRQAEQQRIYERGLEVLVIVLTLVVAL